MERYLCHHGLRQRGSGVSSGYEKAAWEAVPELGQSSLVWDTFVPRAVDWIMLTGGYTLTGVIVLTSAQFLLG